MRNRERSILCIFLEVSCVQTKVKLKNHTCHCVAFEEHQKVHYDEYRKMKELLKGTMMDADADEAESDTNNRKEDDSDTNNRKE
jgi:hypothetical protein